MWRTSTPSTRLSGACMSISKESAPVVDAAINNPRRRKLVDAIKLQSPDGWRLHQEAIKHYAGGVVGAKPPAAPWPGFTSHVEGAYIFDTDGNRFIDCTMSHCAVLLGHNHPDIRHAVIQQAEKGLMYQGPFEIQVAVAEKLKAVLPVNERFVFCNSGTEAMHKAMMLARAHTKRDKVVKFAGTYHGTYDQSILNVRALPYETIPIAANPYIAGIPQRSMDDTFILPMNDEAGLAVIDQHGSDIAAVVLELITSYGLIRTDQTYLEKLAALCKKHGILLVYDEVITGFRLALAGAQSLYGVEPDIIVYGKALGGGMPMGMLATRRNILDPCTKQKPPLMMGGTFSGNAMCMAACNAFLTYLLKHRNCIDVLDARAARLSAVINEHIARKQYPMLLHCVGSLFSLLGMAEPPERPEDMSRLNQRLQDELYLRLRLKGVMLNIIGPNGLSLAHSDEILDELAAKIIEAIDEVFACQEGDVFD